MCALLKHGAATGALLYHPSAALCRCVEKCTLDFDIPLGSEADPPYDCCSDPFMASLNPVDALLVGDLHWGWSGAVDNWPAPPSRAVYEASVRRDNGLWLVEFNYYWADPDPQLILVLEGTGAGTSATDPSAAYDVETTYFWATAICAPHPSDGTVVVTLV